MSRVALCACACACVCAELRPHALALVESFALPDHVVCAPIAFDWVEKGSQGYENEKEERERLLSSLSSQVPLLSCRVVSCRVVSCRVVSCRVVCIVRCVCCTLGD
jgi:hypothetical protein